MHYLPINAKTLKALVKICKHYNIFPIFLPNYIYEEGNHPVTEPAKELTEDVLEYLSIMSPDEVNELIKKLPSGIGMQIGEPYKSGDQKLLNRIAIFTVVAEIQNQYYSFRQIVNENLEDSVVLKEYPELKDKLDKDGLIKVDDSIRLLDGGIEYKNHVLHYHQFLRRGYTSQPNFDFLVGAIQYFHKARSSNQFRIAIDHQRIMPKDFYTRIYEFDTWFGAPFKPDKLDDPNETGLTIIKRNKDSLFELTNHLDRTEFFWSHQNRIKTFQVEEISEFEQRFGHYIFNKYVHSERDTQRKVLRHFDGAVKIYLHDNYKSRYDSFMPNQENAHKKIKLFRIDGNIKIQTWIDLICGFFKGNEMIIQYFNPDHFEGTFEERVRDFKSWKAKQEGIGETT